MFGQNYAVSPSHRHIIQTNVRKLVGFF